ncbi:MAG: DUF6435 family protein [Planctomycetota bacterium]
MFGIFRRDPAKKLEAEYLRLLEQARDLQRDGDIRGYADATTRAEQLAQQIEKLQADGKTGQAR